ncbi:MAG: 2-octaprenyl-6-methoxyphenyl hydroxylase [Panacagrimonas sp.]
MTGEVDVAIVGGGLVGCGLAVALSSQNRRIALIEAFPPRSESPAWDERCIGLNAASRRILDAIGVWDALADSAEPIRSTHISERGRFGSARFTAGDAGLEALGYNTPLRAINDVLWRNARAIPNVRIIMPASLGRMDVLAHDVVLSAQAEGAEDVVLRAKLVVAADGARSAVRDRLGLNADTRDYGQSAVVTAVRPRHAHQGVAYERFLPTGPLALLPKPDDAEGHACSLVWTLPTGRAAELCALEADVFTRLAQDHFGERLGPFHALGKRGSYPLSRVMSQSLRAPRTVFIGNAAQTLHPVAAQGFNLGLRDAATLADLLLDAFDPGDERVLSEYESRRCKDRERVSDFTDQLVRLFSNSLPGLRGLRHLGLLAIDLDTPARDAILRQNLGFGGPVPRLARGP